MYALLRIIRTLFGFVFIWQILGFIPVFSWISNPGAITGNMMALVAIKLLVMAVAGCIFFYGRRVINSMHSKSKGEPHPSLTGVWSL